MRKNGYLFCIVALFLFVSIFSGTALAGSNKPPAPIIRNFTGDVNVKPGSSDQWELIKEQGFKLKNGSTIRTTQGSADISCPDGSVLKLGPNTAATLSIEGDGRVQVGTSQGLVDAMLGNGAITTQIGADQTLQERYSPKTAEIDISCAKGSLVLTMSNGANVALKKGDVITLSLKDKSIKAQAGTVEVTKGSENRSLSPGFQVFVPSRKPFYVRQFPVARARYANMVDPFITGEEYMYTEEYYSEQETPFAIESAIDKEEVSLQEEQKESPKDTESIEGESLQQDDREGPPEQDQDAQEAEPSASASDVSDDTVDTGYEGGGDSGDGFDGGGDSGGDSGGGGDGGGE